MSPSHLAGLPHLHKDYSDYGHTVKLPVLTGSVRTGRMRAMSGPRIITLATDFGIADPYVGTMKGVMLSIAPGAHLVDITHQIRPQDVHQAAFVLYAIWRYFPSQTVHLVVVDPGVGGARRPIAIEATRGYFVAPDNGVLSYILADQPIRATVELADPGYRLPEVSHTFHGRDIFAPAAAHLAAGTPIGELGPAATDPVTLPPPFLSIDPDVVRGEVLYVDHFGNAITSIGRLSWKGEELSLRPPFQARAGQSAQLVAGTALVTAGGREIHGVCRTYAAVTPGDALALVGSTGHLEIAVREGSGAEELGLQRGEPVELRLNPRYRATSRPDGHASLG